MHGVEHTVETKSADSKDRSRTSHQTECHKTKVQEIHGKLVCSVELLGGELILLKLVGRPPGGGFALQNLEKASDCDTECEVLNRTEGLCP